MKNGQYVTCYHSTTQNSADPGDSCLLSCNSQRFDLQLGRELVVS